MIEKLISGGARAVDTFVDRVDVDLFPEEKSLIARAVDKRRSEFATTRACAREALAGLGIDPTPILTGEGGAPVWPPGTVGSMTHCDGYRAAVVAKATDFASIGIDAEPNRSLPEGILRRVSLPEDLPGMQGLRDSGVASDRLLFSAKEALYKAWYPLTQRWLGFEDASVDLQVGGTFSARLRADRAHVDGGTLRGFEGRWMATSALIATVVVVRPGFRIPSELRSSPER